jgi:hypothetical protein
MIGRKSDYYENENANDLEFDEDDQILVQKDIKIKDLENELKEKDEKLDTMISKNAELTEALRQSSFKTGNQMTRGIAQVAEIVKWDYEYKNILLSDFRYKLGELAIEGNNLTSTFNIFLKKL